MYEFMVRHNGREVGTVVVDDSTGSSVRDIGEGEKPTQALQIGEIRSVSINSCRMPGGSL